MSSEIAIYRPFVKNTLGTVQAGVGGLDKPCSAAFSDHKSRNLAKCRSEIMYFIQRSYNIIQ